LEGAEILCFFVVKVVFDETVDATAAGAAAEALTEIRQILGGAGGNYFNIAVFGVAHPAAEVEFAGFAVNEPAEAHALYAALNEEVENHSDHGQSFKSRRCGATLLNPHPERETLRLPRRAGCGHLEPLAR
jgi:hypothetical protein